MTKRQANTIIVGILAAQVTQVLCTTLVLWNQQRSRSQSEPAEAFTGWRYSGGVHVLRLQKRAARQPSAIASAILGTPMSKPYIIDEIEPIRLGDQVLVSERSSK